MRKILVIEDEKFIRDNLLELLEIENFEAVGAENGLLVCIWQHKSSQI
jgi:CheY-like chemotaxis protein